MAGLTSGKSNDKKAEKKKAAKCLQLTMLFIRACKLMNKQEPGCVPEQGACMVKVLEPLCESSKQMSNLKGKLREIKQIVSSV